MTVKIKKKISYLLIIIIVLILCLGSLIYHFLYNIEDKKLNSNEISITNEKSIIKNIEDKNNKIYNVENILLLGIDNEENASDTMIILTIDKTSKKIKLSSLMRDMYVNFGENKTNKLNYAYHYGGIKFAVKTINEQLKLNIKDYVKVNLLGLANVIDYMGGVSIDVKSEEIEDLNFHANEIAKLKKIKYKPITKSGYQILNGVQTTAYCRIRHVGNEDYQRTFRQRYCLSQIMKKFTKEPIKQYPTLIKNLTPYIKTSLTPIEILLILENYPYYINNGIDQIRIPYDGTYRDAFINNIFYLEWDREKNVKKLSNFIFK